MMAAPGKEYLIRFDSEKCTQCNGCEIACKSWRDLPYGIEYRRVLNLWNGTYPKVKSKSLSLSCLHCVEPDCADACPEKAISKNEMNGRVEVNETLCVGCETCAEACIFNIPQHGENAIMQKCDLCLDQTPPGTDPPCVDTCPGEALTLIRVSSTEKKIYEAATAKLIK